MADGTSTYTYDVFGAATHAGGSGNDWQSTGEQEDGSEGLYYLRARYYDPSIGRFLSQDPFTGFMTNPSTQQLYAYARANPTNLVDPSGLSGYPGDMSSFGNCGGAILYNPLCGGGGRGGGGVGPIPIGGVIVGVGTLIGAGAAAFGDSVGDAFDGIGGLFGGGGGIKTLEAKKGLPPSENPGLNNIGEQFTLPTLTNFSFDFPPNCRTGDWRRTAMCWSLVGGSVATFITRVLQPFVDSLGGFDPVGGSTPPKNKE